MPRSLTNTGDGGIPGSRRWWSFATVCAVVAAALAIAITQINMRLVPPQQPPGTNVVITTQGKGAGRPVPDVEQGQRGESSGDVNGCSIAILTEVVSQARITADAVDVWVTQGTFEKVKGATDDPSLPFYGTESGPVRQVWSDQYAIERAKVGRTYRHGPVVIRVLLVWDSPIPQYKRAYLNVTFDNAAITCPPTPAQTVEE